MSKLTQERLKSVFNYNAETGVFTNKVRRANRHIGEVAGSINGLGYCKISVDGKQYLGHRLAWLYVYGKMPEQIDHINCNRFDNRIINLRECNDALNHQNIRDAHKDSKTGKLGVYLLPSGKFRARITVLGQSKHIGCFNTKEEAYIAYLGTKSIVHPFSTLTKQEI